MVNSIFHAKLFHIEVALFWNGFKLYETFEITYQICMKPHPKFNLALDSRQSQGFLSIVERCLVTIIAFAKYTYNIIFI